MDTDGPSQQLPISTHTIAWRRVRSVALFVLVFGGQLLGRHFLSHDSDGGGASAIPCQTRATPVAAVSQPSPVPTYSFPGPSGTACLRIAPGAELHTPSNRHIVIVAVEAGTLTARFSRSVTIGHTTYVGMFDQQATGSRSVPPGTETIVKPGETVNIAFGGDGVLRNTGTTDAYVLLIVG